MAIPGGKAGAQARLRKIREAEASGSAGPFAPSPVPKQKEKNSPLRPSAFATQNMQQMQDRKRQEAEVGGDVMSKPLGYKKGMSK
jgi:hypothetical protein